MNQGDLQQIIYLLVIISAMLIGLFSSRQMSRKKIFKYLLIWGFLGLVIIALYSYRFEFNDFKNRLNREINPTVAQLNSQGQLIINIADDSHFYVKLIINKIPILLMIDTGATNIMLNLDDAKKIGINPQKLNFNIVYQTANGKTLGASIILKEVQISTIKFGNIKASVSDSDMGVSLLGMSFLSQFSKYEFYQDRLILTL